MQDATVTRTSQEQPASIFRHCKRGDWGLALLLWERDGKRGFQFEDGEVRIIAEDYYRLLEEAPGSDPEIVESLAGMAAKAGHQSPAKSKRARAADAPKPPDQLAVFLDRYPGGFEDPAYVKKHRGGAGRRLKRHRQPAIDEAQELLSKEAIDACIASGKHDEVFSRWIDVLSGTDLVSKSHLDPLKKTRPTQELAQAMCELLHGDASIAERFDLFLQELGRSGFRTSSWPLLTTALALVHPTLHVCIRPSVFETQARSIAPALGTAGQPGGERYSQYLEMCLGLRDQLIELGGNPQDLLDLYDFVWLTLRPAENDSLETHQRRRLSAKAAANRAEADEAQAAKASAAADAAASDDAG
jgi:hypothetical protein